GIDSESVHPCFRFSGFVAKLWFSLSPDCCSGFCDRSFSKIISIFR
ncbi:unnamed protein product, partial [Arabidopsis halleri]